MFNSKVLAFTKVISALTLLLCSISSWSLDTETFPIPNPATMSGLVYDPDNSGHGFDINVLDEGLVIYYYGHTSERERLWLISGLHTEAVLFNSPIELNMYEITDGSFGVPNPPSTEWGTLTLELIDCDSGTALLS